MTMCYGKMAIGRSVKCSRSNSKLLATSFLVTYCVAFMVHESIASRPGCNRPLGMEDGRITDSQLSADSHDTGWGSNKGRLNGDFAWCSDSQKVWTSYFQIHLDRVRHVSGISTQGQKFLVVNYYYVKSYAIKYSLDGSVWYWYKDPGSANIYKTFTANVDYSTVKKNTFRDTFVTQYLRIYPITYNKDMCIRVEVYGCEDGKDSCSHFATQSAGEFTSLHYPSLYPKGTDCTWIVSLPDKSKRAALIFKDFDVQDGQTWGCRGDHVTVLDGPLDTSNAIGSFCNGQPLPVVKTTGSVFRVQFHSDSGSVPRKGFQAKFVSFTPGVDDVRASMECKGSSVSLNCSSSSKSIQIFHAFYGAFPYSANCGSSGSDRSCIASNTVTRMTSLCEHYKVCKVKVEGPDFDVTCAAGIKPRLDVYYQCTGTIIKTMAPVTTTAPPSTRQSTAATANNTKLTTTAITITINPPSTNLSSRNTDIATTAPVQLTTAQPTRPNPPVTKSNPTERINRSTSSTPTDLGGAGEKGARTDGRESSGLVIGIVIAAVCIIILVVVGLLCFVYKRRRKAKGSPVPDVTYSAAPICPASETSYRDNKTGHSTKGSRGNEYESVNVLYVSADEPISGGEYSSIHDSPEMCYPSKITDNPLYDVSGPGNGYESIDVSQMCPLTYSSDSNSPVYDSPLDAKKKSSSITNPNYEKTIDIPEA